jgi:D-amino-acid dehydrogenase
MRIAVLGAGIVGVSTAEWLRRDGHAVTLIDRVAPGDPAQASHGNAGVLAAGSIVPVPVPGLWLKAPRMLLDPDGALFLKWRHLPRLLPWLARYLAQGRRDRVERIAAALAPLVSDTVTMHAALAEGTGAEAHVGTARFTHLHPDRASWEGNALARALERAAGVRFETLDRAALAERDPALGPAYRFGVEFTESGMVTDPGAYMAALAEHFVREGGTLRRAEIADARPEGEGVAVTAGGETARFDHAVIAMGAWSGTLARRLGHDPALESERGYHLMLERPSRMPPVPYLLADSKFVATPMAGGLRLAGLDEFGGLEAPPSAAPTRFQRRRARRLYPDLEWEGESVWMGHRPSTIDSLPLLGPSPKAPAISFAFGTQHLGLTMGPKLGRLVADTVAGRRPNIDMAPYRVGRFDRAGGA